LNTSYPPAGAGGDGAGIILISSNSINVSGAISADGTDGGTVGSSAGGGGGAGGSVKLTGNSIALGTNKVTAAASAGGSGYNIGGAGGYGRTAIYYTTSYSGSTTVPTPSYTVQPYYPYGLYHSGVISTPNAVSLSDLRWDATTTAYGKVSFQTRTGNTADPSGVMWTKYNNDIPTASDTTGTDGRIPLGTAGKGDVTRTMYPSIILDEGTYKMWYTGYDGTNYRIYYATSPDGLTWTKYNNAIPTASDTTGTDGRIPLGTAGKGDVTNAYLPRVIKDGSAYKMWYSGYDGTNIRTFYATSPDGLTWTKYNNAIPTASDTTGTDGRIPVGTAGKGDVTHAYSPSVILDGGTYKMWYSGSDGTNTRTFYATSPDGLTWTKYNNAIPTASDTTGTDGRIPVGTAGKGDVTHVYIPSVILDGSTYKMWYSGSDGANSRTFYTTSPDGLIWTKYNNAIPTASDTTGTDGRVPVGTAGKGDVTHAYTPSVILDGSTYKMWYSGYDGTNYRIYSATNTPDNSSWEAWRPAVASTNYLSLQDANTHTDWTGTDTTVAEGDVTRNVDMFEDEDESIVGNMTKLTSSTNGGYATNVITTADLSSYDYLTFWVRASQTGNTVQIGMGESLTTEQTEMVTIDAANTWQKVYWDLSDIAAASRNGITRFRLTNLTASSNTIYIDNIQAEKAMTVSSGTPIASTPNNYFQYRAIVTTTNTNYQPQVNNVQFSYNNGYKIVQTDANTVRLYNASGTTQELKLDAVVYGADLAEWYAVEDQAIGAGDVVALTGFMDDYSVPILRKATTDSGSNIVGIISTKAGTTLGLESAERRLLGLAGRVPVKVASDSAKISAGDFIAASDTPGMAKPAQWGDMIIGKALEPWFPNSDKSTVLVLINDPAPYYPVLTRTLDQISTIVEGATYMSKAIIDNVTITNKLTSVSIDTDQFSTNTATISGLVAGTIDTTTISAQNASVSGDLYAAHIISPTIDNAISTLSARISTLESQVASPAAQLDYSYLDTMIASLSARLNTSIDMSVTATESALTESLVASSSASLSPEPSTLLTDANLDAESVFVSDFLSVTGESILTNVAINGSLAIGNWNVTATESQLSFGDLLTLDSTGNLVTITGNLKVTGLADLNQLTSVDATISGELKANTLTVDTIYNKQLEQLASQSANLAAQVASLSAVLGTATSSTTFNPSTFTRPTPLPTPRPDNLPIPLEEYLQMTSE